mgnify:CR=1 FL=1
MINSGFNLLTTERHYNDFRIYRLFERYATIVARLFLRQTELYRMLRYDFSNSFQNKLSFIHFFQFQNFNLFKVSSNVIS